MGALAEVREIADGGLRGGRALLAAPQSLEEVVVRLLADLAFPALLAIESDVEADRADAVVLDQALR